MPKSENQKLKLLYIIKILKQYSDEEHLLTTQKIIEYLAQVDIKAERKSIYDDLKCLSDFGYDIIAVKSKKDGGYYLENREFEMPELKLLVDAVQASRFFTQKKSRELIAKLEQFASSYDAKQLQRQVFVSGRIKAANESIYYTVDQIHKSMQENRMISFVYLEWNIDKELIPKKAGAQYVVSPWALTFKDENYYLVAWEVDKIKHFRVDKITRMSILKENRLGSEQFKQIDVAQYTNKSFGMYGGKEEMVSLLISREKIGILIDRFGKDINIRSHDEKLVCARISVNVSRQFFGWLAGLSTDVIIKGPTQVRLDYQKYIEEILHIYEEKNTVENEMGN